MKLWKNMRPGCLLALALALFLHGAAVLAAPAAQPSPPAAASQAARQPGAYAPVMDDAGLLSASEAQKLSAKIQQVEKKHGVRMGIVVQNFVSGNINAATNSLLDAGFADGQNGGIVLMLAMQSRDWCISTDKTMRNRITDDAGIPYLREQFLPELREGDYAKAFSSYVDAVDEMLEYYEAKGEPYDPSSAFSPLALFLALVLSLLGGLAVRSSLIASMSNVMHKAEAETYLVQGSVKLTGSEDRFLFMNVTRTEKRKPSDEDRASSHDENHGGGSGKF